MLLIQLLLHVFSAMKQWISNRWLGSFGGKRGVWSKAPLRMSPTASRHRTDALELNEWMGDHWETRRFESGVGGGVELQGVIRGMIRPKGEKLEKMVEWRAGRFIILNSKYVYIYIPYILIIIIMMIDNHYSMIFNVVLCLHRIIMFRSCYSCCLCSLLLSTIRTVLLLYYC